MTDGGKGGGFVCSIGHRMGFSVTTDPGKKF